MGIWGEDRTSRSREQIWARDARGVPGVCAGAVRVRREAELNGD